MNSEVIVYVNGNSAAISKGSRLSDYLFSRGWKPTQVVVELNGNVVSRPDVDKILLNEGDKVEIVVPVAGG